jgi:chromate reductase
MKNILVFGASNSKNSINKQLAFYAASLLNEVTLTKIDLNDFEMPIYGIDKEKENGIPQKAHNFKQLIKNCDGIIISIAEHNGNVTAAFKNLFDWTSRIEKSMWNDKPMFLLATSPGARGGSSALGIVTKEFPFRGGKVTASFSLSSFNDNFSTENGITNPELKEELLKQLNLFSKEIH